MKKQLLGLMLLSGALLIGCQDNSVEPVDEIQEPVQVQETAEEREARLEQIREEKRKQDALEAKERQQVQNTEEEEQNENNFGYDEMDEFLREELARDIQNYEDNKANGNETYLEVVGDIIGKDIEAGLTYENFLLVGTVDFNSIGTINELFGKQGELIGEQQNVQQYRWTQGSGSTYKVVQIMFVDGKVESKTQSGL